MVLGKVYRISMGEDRFHDFGIARDFLFISGFELFDFDVAEELVDLLIGQLAALDPGRRTDAFDRRYVAKGRQALRGQRPQRAPCALELIQLGNQREDFRCDLQGIGVQSHTHIYIRKYP